MRKLLGVTLGIVTSIGGYLEVGSIGTGLQAGASFRFSLLWPLALGTVCIAFLTEMTGRLAAVSKHSAVEAVRERFGFSFQIWPFAAQVIVDLFVLASEIGGASLALELATGISIRFWAIPVAALIWGVLWFGTFDKIEHAVALLGLVTLSFAVAAYYLSPDWHQIARGLVPSTPSHDPAKYAYLAVAILGATVSPYLVTFYSSGAIEEKWKASDLMPNRLVAGAGMTFGGVVGAAVIIVSAMTLLPRGIEADTYQQAAALLTVALPRWGFRLFVASLFIGCVGAALELALDCGYITAQTFGWKWGEDQAPASSARFALTYTAAVLVAAVPSLLDVDPLKLTMFSMALTVIALPIVIGPLIVVMNDKAYLKQHTNGLIANVAVVAIIALAFLLALVAVPVQLLGS